MIACHAATVTVRERFLPATSAMRDSGPIEVKGTSSHCALLTLTLAFAVALALAGTATARTVAGVELPARTRLGDHTLALASCGVRDTLWIEHYVAALYLPSGPPKSQAVRDPKQPKVIEMHVLGSASLPDRVPQRWRATLRDELRRDPLARVRAAYRDLAAGDRVRAAYVPGEGVSMTVNGRVVAEVPGHDLIAAMLRAWAENDPISGKLRRMLLEHPC
jgi:hypothetical protein